MACLIRSDFNFAVIFFCYFAWQNRKDLICINLVLFRLMKLTALVTLTLILDIVFAVVQGRKWMQLDDMDMLWNSLAGLHKFSLFCSAIVFILKIVLLWFLCSAKRIYTSSVI